ncbi:MAG TPA: hypothetical protein VFV34_11850 [Blastocatellia bacterium]|nr:hypothetical protein [Blastocatellia bacterium]
MHVLECMRAEEEVEITGRLEIDPSIYAGTWLTTNSETRGIVKMIVEPRGGHLMVRTFGACSPEPCDWGETVGVVFADGALSAKALAFSASYDFGFMETHLQAKIKKGVLVVAGFNSFKDDSGRSNYFSREFFYRPDETK